MTTSECEVVAALEQALIHRLGEPRYHMWFDGHAHFQWNEDRLQVGVPNLHFQEWLQKKFGSTVVDSAREVFHRPMRVKFVIDPKLFQAARRDQEGVAARNPMPPDGRQNPTEIQPEETPNDPSQPQAGAWRRFRPDRPHRANPPRRTRRWLRLADFIVGPCNRVAHASAQGMVEDPAAMAGPLVWHGPVGTGKTHLLEAVYLGLRKNRPDWRICYLTAEDFTNRFLAALRAGKLGGFRRQFRDCDALLLDDLQFLAGKKATRVEFLHTLDALLRDGKPVLATCDCHPRLADDWAPELVDRLLGGAIWGLLPPEEDTRLAILRAKATATPGPALTESVLTFLAQIVRGNVRELEGALRTLRHYSLATNRPVDVALAREALTDWLRHAVRPVALADVDAAVCRVMQIPAGSLQSKARTWMVSHPRMLAMYLARKYTNAAYSEVGQFFGARTHSTAVAAEKKVRQWLEDDESWMLGGRSLRVREIVERSERWLRQ